LRPHEITDALSTAPGASEAVHFAALEDGIVVGTAVVWREAAPWDPADERSWRLRGMATDEAKRRQGIGADLLRTVLDYVELQGGRRLWCGARTPARSFYERAGFVSRGDVWDEPHVGPHVMMERPVGRR
jgi:GNAT superfamily N-acetyltransferase